MSLKHYSMLVFGLYLLAFNLNAAEKIYRWTNSNGVVNYSHVKPTDSNVKFEEITMRNSDSFQAADKLGKQTKGKGNALSEFDKIAQENCEIAKQNVKVLSAFKNITQQDKDGNTVKLSADDRNEQLALANKQVAVFCKKSA